MTGRTVYKQESWVAVSGVFDKWKHIADIVYKLIEMKYSVNLGKTKVRQYTWHPALNNTCCWFGECQVFWLVRRIQLSLLFNLYPYSPPIIQMLVTVVTKDMIKW